MDISSRAPLTVRYCLPSVSPYSCSPLPRDPRRPSGSGKVLQSLRTRLCEAAVPFAAPRGDLSKGVRCFGYAMVLEPDPDVRHQPVPDAGILLFLVQLQQLFSLHAVDARMGSTRSSPERSRTYSNRYASCSGTGGAARGCAGRARTCARPRLRACSASLPASGRAFFTFANSKSNSRRNLPMRVLRRLAFPDSLVCGSMWQAGSDGILILLPSPGRRLRRMA